jgi:hypothetical protein
MTKLTEARDIATHARTEAIAVSHPEEAAETLSILGNAEHVLPEVFGRWGPIEMAKVKMPIVDFLKGIAIGAKDSFFSKFPTTLPEIGSLIVRTVIPGGNQIVAGLEIAYEGVQSAKAKMDQAIEKVDTVQKELVAKGQEKVQRLSEKLGVDKLNTRIKNLEAQLANAELQRNAKLGKYEKAAYNLTEKIPDPGVELPPVRPARGVSTPQETGMKDPVSHDEYVKAQREFDAAEKKAQELSVREEKLAKRERISQSKLREDRKSVV